jgi:NAD(P)-dependent dehydrogenase (short-subunit alcohol dehydrogenase family)
MEQLEEKVVGYFRCARAATPYLKKAGWGRIINLSGQYGRMPRDSTGHGARNAAVVNLTKSMANSLGPAGINAIAVYPGFTLTEAFYEHTRQDAERDGKNVETVLAEMAHNTNIRHLVTPEDVAVVIAFLCSPLAIAIQGEAIAVNGGANADVHY